MAGERENYHLFSDVFEGWVEFAGKLPLSSTENYYSGNACLIFL